MSAFHVMNLNDSNALQIQVDCTVNLVELIFGAGCAEKMSTFKIRTLQLSTTKNMVCLVSVFPSLLFISDKLIHLIGVE